MHRFLYFSRRLLAAATLILLGNAAIGAKGGADATPAEWAYGTAPTPSEKTAPGDPKAPHSLPGSSLTFTRPQITNPLAPADWYPGDHPEMPEIVARGRKPAGIWACGLCHYPNGKGRPENAGVAGLPVSYFIHQMEDFRDGLRHSADSRKKNTGLMIAYAKAMTNEEIKEAAKYYGAMQWTPWIRVVETRTVPQMRLSVGMYLPIEGSTREAIGKRIIETPEDARKTEELRDPRSGFVAYVPPGSLKRGKDLVITGGRGRTVACASCHGAGLKGLGPVPGIAGRSPSYLARQLYDMKAGTRKGEWTQMMLPVVEKLCDDDIIAICAYTASLRVQ